MTDDQPIYAILVSESGVPYATSVDDILYLYRETPLRERLLKAGVPYGRQPPTVKECARLLARKLGLTED